MNTHCRFSLTAVAFALLLAMAAPIQAEQADTAAPPRSNDPTSGDVVLFPGPLHAIETYNGDQPLTHAPGWHIAGRFYKSGEGWWALACQKTCSLNSTRLTVAPLAHPDYDGPPLPGQHLVWSPLPWQLGDPSAANGDAAKSTAPSAALIMLFKPIRALSGLKIAPGPVKTWLHAGMNGYPRPAGAGTMETLIRMDDSDAILKPRLVKPAPAAPNEPPQSALVFELRAYGLTQRLGTYEWDIEGPRALGGREYLLWAGDLDGDGKLDLLMSFQGRGWNTVLFLSSLAKPGAIVGEAGRFNYWPPNDPGC